MADKKKIIFFIGLFFLLLSACGGGGKGAGINTTLTNLSIEAGSLAQVFQSNQFSYTATVGSLQSTLSIMPTATDSRAQIHVNGIVVASGISSPQIPLEHGENTIFITVSSPDNLVSTYVLTIRRPEYQGFSQRGLFKASNTGADDLFGVSVAIDGNTIAIGAPFEDSAAENVPNDNTTSAAGAVYIFTFSNNVWREQARIKASNAELGDHFGESLVLQGDTLIVGAPQENGVNNTAVNAGAVYVYKRTGLTWSEEALLYASNVESNDLFGSSITLSGNVLVIGAPGEASNAGAAYTFVLNNNIWTEQSILKASNAEAGDRFGGSVALSGKAIVVGASGEDSRLAFGVTDNLAPDSGAAYVFQQNGLSWTEQQILKASNAEGIRIDPLTNTTTNGDQFGHSVAIFGDTVVVGAYFEDSSVAGAGDDNLAPDAGAAYVFVREAGIWTQQALIKASNADVGDNFGISLALRGNTLIIGAWTEDSTLSIGLLDNSASGSGIVYIFDRFNGTWSEKKTFKPTNSDPGDLFGASVAISNNRMLAAAIREDSSLLGPDTLNPVLDSGAVYIAE